VNIKKPEINPLPLLKQLPPFAISAEELAEELRIVCKNTSIRLSQSDQEEMKYALALIYLMKKRGYKKAALFKECFKRGLPSFFEEQEGESKILARFVGSGASGVSL
jgi:hypothetical protein